MRKTLFILCSICISGQLLTQTASAQSTAAPGTGTAPAKDAANELSIIPEPLSVRELPGSFKLSSQSTIYIASGNPELELLAGMLSDRLGQVTGFPLPVSDQKPVAGKSAIILGIEDGEDSLGTEGYRLSVRPESVHLTATAGNGIFYGIQTIYQLVPAELLGGGAPEAISIPAVEISDKPRYSWRGMMLDVGRYFYPVSFIKKFLDYLALHKMNTFHWHLTEDHGWRIEIKKYPRLTEVGAWRPGTQMDHSGRINEQLHGGYYTQEEIREVVAYAKERYITVIPEIEMPGHAMAALVAFPELSCTGGPFDMLVKWGIQSDIFCAGNEKTFQFLEDVLTEVAGLFPSPIIHIGGDEAWKDRWEVCGKCQARIKSEGLKGVDELQSYFIRRIEDFLLTKNKRIIGWDEILEGGLAPNAAVMSWRGTEGGITAARQHHDVVMCPTSHMYFDYYQGDPSLEPYAIGGYTPLEKVYSYEPTPDELSQEEAKFILGVQGNIWSEFIHDPEKVEYMGFPRGAALAEVAWTQPQLKDWENFKRKLEDQYKRYDAAGINYATTARNVQQETVIDSLAARATVTLSTASFEPEIRYTLDGSAPTASSLRYEDPITIDRPLLLKAANFKDGKRISAISKQYFNEEKLHKEGS